MNNNNWHVPLDRLSDEQRKVIERVYGSMQININRYFGFYNGLVLFVDVKESLGKEITPNEAFAILGLDRLLDTDLVTVNNLKAQNKALHQVVDELEQEKDDLNAQGEIAAHELHEAEQKIKELKQKLIESNGFRGKAERLLDEESFKLAQLRVQLKDCQHKLASQTEQGLQGVDWPDNAKHLAQYGECVWFVGDVSIHPSWTILATRPKPKVKPLTDEQIEAVREFDKWLINDKPEIYKPNMIVDAWLKEREL